MKNLKSPKSDWKRYNKEKCPICSRKSDGCLVNISANKVICLHVASDKPVPSGKGIGGHFHDLVPGATPVFETKVREKKMLNMASPDVLDKVYRTFLNQHPLTQEHREYLTGRQVDPSGYGSLSPVPGNFKNWFGVDPSGVPGFFRSFKGEWMVNCLTNGILIPVKNYEGKIVGLQIRTQNKSGKYRAFSTNNFHFGTKAEQFTHFVDGPGDEVYITEGVFKAEISARILNKPFFAVPGVHAIDDLMVQLKRSRFKKVVIAYDSDVSTNPNVASAYEKLQQILIAQDVETWAINWSKSVKGTTQKVDDYLLEGNNVENKLIYKPNYISLSHARDKMSILFENFFQDNENGIQLVKGTPGVGKSTAMVQAINNMYNRKTWPTKGKMGLKRKRILILMDNHKNLLELQEKFDFEVPIMKGRQDKQGDPFYCENKSLCDKAGAAGHNVVKSVCQECPMFNSMNIGESGCGYWVSTSKLNKSDIVLATKASFLNYSSRLSSFDFVMIDEDLSGWLFNDIRITQDDIFEHMEVVEFLEGRDGEMFDSDNPYIQRLLDISEMMQDASDNEIEQKEVKFETLYDPIPYSEDKVFRVSQHKWLFPKKFLAYLDKSSVFISKDGLDIKVPRKNILRLLESRSTMNLDATPLMSMLDQLDVKKHEFNVKQHMVVHQVRSVKGSRRQLETDYYKQKYLKAINAIGKKHEKAAFFGIKSFVEENLEDIQMPTGHFGFNTRATNDFKDYDAIVSLDWCININYAHHWAAAINLFTDNQSNVTTEDIVNEISENEKIQCIGRGRPVQRNENNPLYVYILSNRLLKTIKVDRWITNLEELYDEQYQRDINNQKSKKESEAKVRKALDYWCNEKGVDPHTITVKAITKRIDVCKEVVKRVLDEYKSIKLQSEGLPSCYANMEVAYNNEQEAQNMLKASNTVIRTSGVPCILINKGIGEQPNVLYVFPEQVEYLRSHTPATKGGAWDRFLDACLLETMSKTDLAKHIGISRRQLDRYIEYAMGALKDFESSHDEKRIILEWLQTYEREHNANFIFLIGKSYNVEIFSFLEAIRALKVETLSDEMFEFIKEIYMLWWHDSN